MSPIFGYKTDFNASHRNDQQGGVATVNNPAPNIIYSCENQSYTSIMELRGGRSDRNVAFYAQ